MNNQPSHHDVGDKILITLSLLALIMTSMWFGFLAALMLEPQSEMAGFTFYSVLKDWQGLEAGLLAIAAAFIGARAVNRQSRLTSHQNQESLARRLRARRATLPLTLSNLMDWADECGLILLQTLARVPGSAIAPNSLQRMPSVADDLISELDRFVEASDEAGALSVANLLADIQVFLARMRSAGFLGSQHRQRHVTVHDLQSATLGIAAISAHVGSLFEFSRRRSDLIVDRPSWDDVRTSLRLLGADELLQPDLFQLLDARERSGRSPGYVAVASA